MKKKVSIIITMCVLAAVVIAITVGCVWTEVANNPKYYTYEEHFEKVSEIISAKRDDFTLDYLYTEDDEILGFIALYSNGSSSCIKISNPLFIQKVLGATMYREARDTDFKRYKIRPGETSLFEDGILWTKTNDKSFAAHYPDRLWETVEYGNTITRFNPYDIDGIEKEKKYLLKVTIGGEEKYVPAVKREDKYLNLISYDKFEYKEEYEADEIAVWNIWFDTGIAAFNFD